MPPSRSDARSLKRRKTTLPTDSSQSTLPPTNCYRLDVHDFAGGAARVDWIADNGFRPVVDSTTVRLREDFARNLRAALGPFASKARFDLGLGPRLRLTGARIAHDTADELLLVGELTRDAPHEGGAWEL